jgi:hypothetical protein
LQAIPRGSGASTTNIRSHRFTTEGEARLTDWMTTHLDYAFTVAKTGNKANEDKPIAQWAPPLNLTGWHNPQRRQLRALRAVCRAEARYIVNGQGAAP